MDDALTGGCLCGRVRYRLPLAAVRFGFASCHCSICRRLHGAPFAMWLGIGRDAAAHFAVADPTAATAFAATAEAERHFCRTCGTHTHLVYGDGSPRWRGEVHVATATLDDACVPRLEEHVRRTGKPRHVHVFYSDRAACLGDLDEWAGAAKLGGATGVEPLPAPPTGASR
jgi:hypothetical protein